MDKKKKITLIAVIIIAGIALILWLTSLINRGQTNEEPTGGQTENSNIVLDDSALPTPGDRPNIDYSQYDVNQEQAHQIDSEDLMKEAIFFAERLGSFSNQSDYGNISDLMMFMTESMRSWAEGYIDQLRESYSDSQYYGISTTAITSMVDSFDDQAGEAAITVATKRQEVKGEQESSFNQSLKVLLIKEQGEWKIDGAYWEK